ncbi:MAG: prepilin peptidase [Phycisphaerales bacterium]
MTAPTTLAASLAFYQWSLALTGLAFVFSLGAIVGSFLNVVVYRLPAGVGLVSPPSRCPHCDTRLTWRENIPILGWLLLRGRCRFCKSKISIQYPLIEALVAVLFSIPYVLWFMRPSLLNLIGFDPAPLTPDWAADGLRWMWPQLIILWTLLASLVAITLIDARTFMIPGSLPRLIIGVAVVVHPLHALWIQHARGGILKSDAVWTIPTLDTRWIAIALFATAGLIISEVLLRLRIFPLPFADYDEWAEQHERTRQQASTPPPAEPTAPPDTPLPDPTDHAPDHRPSDTGSISIAFRRALYLTGPALALMLAGFSIGIRIGAPLRLAGLGLLIGLGIGLPLRRLVPDDPAPTTDPNNPDAPSTHPNADEPDWVLYPHARREMGKELLLVAPVLAAGTLGWLLAAPGAALHTALVDPPLWLHALAASLLGLLVGGGLVWGIRILATLGFGKEAMGFGDVHLMAAVGAATGWLVPVLAFFTAPFPALLWAAASVIAAPLFKRAGSALPFGPHLAAATVFVVFAWPLYEWGARALAGNPAIP